MHRLRDIKSAIGAASMPGEPDILIRGIAYDSREVRDGFIFVALVGEKLDGHDFVGDAVSRGAVAVVVEHDLPVSPGVPVVRVDDTRKALALASRVVYDDPSGKLELIGVTGTNGKTTTTYLVKAILEAGEHPTGLIGTIQNIIGDRVEKARRTTPESPDIQALLRQMVEAGMSHAVMEVSSHAVVLKRTFGLDFDIGVFTNITQDHLDFHKTFESYLDAKAEFFRELGRFSRHKSLPKFAVINADDPYKDAILKGVSASVMAYGLSNKADVVAHDLELHAGGTRFRAATPSGMLEVSTRLRGRFNVYNSLAAIACGIIMGVSLGEIREGLAEVGVPGRFESVDVGQDFAVIVDYAHTPDGLDNILRAASEFVKGRKIVVFGCGGDRDRTKRPIMGRIAARLADHVIITSDNPRSESPERIAAEIEQGVVEEGLGPSRYTVILDRRQAIARAIEMAAPGDAVIIAGKGHEDYQIFRDKTIKFDDRAVARELLEERAIRTP